MDNLKFPSVEEAKKEHEISQEFIDQLKEFYEDNNDKSKEIFNPREDK